MTSHNEDKGWGKFEEDVLKYGTVVLDEKFNRVDPETVKPTHNEAQKTNEDLIAELKWLPNRKIRTQRQLVDEHNQSINKVLNLLTLKDTQHATEKADWLRSEIEKLEEMDGEDLFDSYDEPHAYNKAITSIITRYKEELKVLEK